MSLLLQLDGNLPAFFPMHERRLYILVCRNRTCQRNPGSTRVLRATKVLADSEGDAIQASAPKQKPPAGTGQVGHAIFGIPSSKKSLKKGSPPASPKTGGGEKIRKFNPFAQRASPSPTAQAGGRCLNTGQIDPLPATFAQKVTIGASPLIEERNELAPWPSKDTFSSPFPGRNLDAEYENFDPPNPGSEEAKKHQRIDLHTGCRSAPQDDIEAFESPDHAMFQRFADRLAYNPEQVVRYDFGGYPLLYSEVDAVGALLSGSKDSRGSERRGTTQVASALPFPPCQTCRSPRLFELQIMPHAIAVLEADQVISEGMEWGTIMIAVCSEDCHRKGQGSEVFYAEEWAGVQWEETRRLLPK